MSSLYDPDTGAKLVQRWEFAFRAQRDVALRIPINFVTAPAVSLRAACFSKNQYESKAFKKCFSNLFSVGFRRFLVDVYWDTGRSEWSLCPVQIPPSGLEAESAGITAINTVFSTAQRSISPPTRNARDIRDIRFSWEAALPTYLPKENAIPIWPRQDASTSESVSGSPPLSSGNILPAASLTAAETVTALASSISAVSSKIPVKFPTDGSVPLLQLGDYNCTSIMTLGYLTGVFQDYLDASGTTTDAVTTYLFLNIHAASPYASPYSPAQQLTTEQLPGPQHLLSIIINSNLSSQLYTPQQLQEDRNNLNETWLDVQSDTLPARGYYQTSENSEGFLVTQNGWPNEAYMVFKKFYRLVASFGSVDPQMANYNFSADANTIFAPGTTRSLHNASITSDGGIESGCLFAPIDLTITTSTNSSWAIATSPDLDLGLNPNDTLPIPAITNLTSCGLSPMLNSSLSNVTADFDFQPYLAFTHSTLWSWNPGEPINNTSDDSSARTRCAAIYATPPYPGRWRSVNCNSRNRVACQHPDTPYNWTISADSVNYFSGDTACPRNTIFSVPHTPLENAHLLSVIQSSSSPSHPLSDPIFVNLNALDVPNCWVIGTNGTCPYLPPNDTNNARVVVVPTVAAVIIFVLAALTFFVKCAANRREDKRGRRRRNVGGWDYEGVPS
ncbi:uncharacterized protein BDR25DRAFT_345042 [Lindgomyces ingoldianus]|uniref:Uncharacterized protein n=1 Tax=Lindgomyces ingoldianus TaxID=673940 RepID=A0ACB6QK04_9PLEO|nr:uncharacterized protein BDR25DRAFT_345042 [Lindgomyces ingoldianus]KAF2467289.1 hypothetical protein BDR25DRAFT_345042 [Lindgomyces ingoldianus]